MSPYLPLTPPYLFSFSVYGWVGMWTDGAR